MVCQNVGAPSGDCGGKQPSGQRESVRTSLAAFESPCFGHARISCSLTAFPDRFCSVCVVTDPGVRNSQLVHHDNNIVRAIQEHASGRFPTEMRTRGLMGTSNPIWGESFTFTEAVSSTDLHQTLSLQGSPLVLLLLIRDDYSAHAAVAAVHVPAPRGSTGVSDDWHTLRDPGKVCPSVVCKRLIQTAHVHPDRADSETCARI